MEWNSERLHTRTIKIEIKDKRHDNLLEIAVSFGTEKEEVEKKFRYLLSHFNRERKKEKEQSKSGAGTQDTY